MKARRSRTGIRNLLIFIVAVLASGWIGRGVDVWMGSPPASESLGMLLWLVLPIGTALLLRAFAGDGWRDLGLKPRFRGNGKWYLVALLVYPVLTTLVLAIGRGVGWITWPNLSLSALGLLLQASLLGFLPQFVKNIFEESAWRGHLTPKVYALGLNDFTANLIVGLVWGAWHIPYYLFFLDRADLAQFTVLSVAAFIPVSIVAMIAWSMVYGELRLLTNSFWPAVLMHMVEDAFLNQLFTGRYIQIVPGTDWLISPVNGLAGILLFAGLGIGLRYLRKRKGALPARRPRWRLSRQTL